MGAPRTREKKQSPIRCQFIQPCEPTGGSPTPKVNLNQRVDCGLIASKENDSQAGQSPQ